MLNLKATHKVIKNYFAGLDKLEHFGATNEGAVKPVFSALLKHCARQMGWTLLEEQPLDSIRVDGLLVDDFKLHQGYWEAKDSADILEKEVKKKFAAGYPRTNILFQAPRQVILIQDGREMANRVIEKAEDLIEVLRLFFAYRPPAFDQWQQAVEQFKDKVPQLAAGLVKLIEKERETNPRFAKALRNFTELCKQAINPNIAPKAVEEMLIQHLLTERIFRKVFNNPDFARRNIIAAEIEKVIAALTSRSFNRFEFLKKLDHFYVAIEETATHISDFHQKQDFLNTIYEKFFQGFSVKVADTHGIVYTPQPIVRFMVNSVEEILQKEFGKSLADEGVHIIDPFVGTGNFMLHIMRKIPKSRLAHKYRHELHCNEVMLLPYYIASMNIEHEYYELTGEYEPFEGICLVDTFELAEPKQSELLFMNEENTQRVQQQKDTPIFVVIGNPPYNAGQVNENDNNKNRKYKEIDSSVKDTYAKDSKATNKNALSDVYVKAIRWATNRIGEEGIVNFVCNNSFIDNIAFDGMRKHLGEDFERLYLLDLKGNIRKDSMRDGIPLGEKNTVFGLSAMVGVSTNFFIKKPRYKKKKVYYHAVDFRATRAEKFALVDNAEHANNLKWKLIKPDAKHTWLTEGLHAEFETFLPLGTKEAKGSKEVFKLYSNGAQTNRDIWAYQFKKRTLKQNVKIFLETYNLEVSRWHHKIDKSQKLDDFLIYDDHKIKWCSKLKERLLKYKLAEYNNQNIRYSIYRPFTKMHLYFDDVMVHRQGKFQRIFPTPETEEENEVICITCHSQIPFVVQIMKVIPSLDVGGRPTQDFPFYVYDDDGSNRRENITDWALEAFRAHYKNKKIGKWDIFHYAYGLLHHPGYREKYAANLRRELPRLPFAPDFFAFAKAGKKLAALHVNYEQQKEYPLDRMETPGLPLDWRVEKMKLSKDKTQLIYNDFLSLGGIPPAAFEYRLGNRSALDWVIDQYRVKTDKRSGIVNDPNRADDPEYIVRLIGRVLTVSVETVKIVKSLPQFE